MKRILAFVVKETEEALLGRPPRRQPLRPEPLPSGSRGRQPHHLMKTVLKRLLGFLSGLSIAAWLAIGIGTLWFGSDVVDTFFSSRDREAAHDTRRPKALPPTEEVAEAPDKAAACPEAGLKVPDLPPAVEEALRTRHGQAPAIAITLPDPIPVPGQQLPTQVFPILLTSTRMEAEDCAPVGCEVAAWLGYSGQTYLTVARLPEKERRKGWILRALKDLAAWENIGEIGFQTDPTNLQDFRVHAAWEPFRFGRTWLRIPELYFEEKDGVTDWGITVGAVMRWRLSDRIPNDQL